MWNRVERTTRQKRAAAGWWGVHGAGMLFVAFVLFTRHRWVLAIFFFAWGGYAIRRAIRNERESQDDFPQ
jgi:hypothetical protein